MGFGRYRQDLGVQGLQAARDEAGKVQDLGTTTPLTRVERRPVRQRASFPPDRERLLHLLLEDHLPEVGGDLGTPGHGSGSLPTPPNPSPASSPALTLLSSCLWSSRRFFISSVRSSSSSSPLLDAIRLLHSVSAGKFGILQPFPPLPGVSRGENSSVPTYPRRPGRAGRASSRSRSWRAGWGPGAAPPGIWRIR